ncbi:hypothetical protein FC36_GL000957 [Ligilactobacillus equi DSM 15833 = JCM 10991]|uniref:UPF0342 protein FC36_GL000957 n=2 Tax=Ligilactobacillus equi TaxID=137357 RepID=A0A0R1TBN1_9LACO|nr:hypothetical protein FC36_GL000957 [Ligilactobacillus equi DSM 15833 = JCM 10991]
MPLVAYLTKKEFIKMINIYDTINQLEQDLRKTQGYLDLKQAYETLKQDGEAYQIFKDIRQMQEEMQAKQMQGTLGQEDMEKLQALGQKVEEFPSLKELMMKEQVLSMIINEAHAAMMKPINEMYQD